MSFTSLKNSEGVNKPFRSPFSNNNTLRNENAKSNPNTPESSSRSSKEINKPFRSPFHTVNTPRNENVQTNTHTPESTCKTQSRVPTSKRLLFDQTPPAKRSCLSKENNEEDVNVNEKQDLFRKDLDALRKRVNEKQEAIDSLKTTLLYKRKNKAEDVEAEIERWTEACQNALRDYQNDLQERFGRSVDMIEILSTFSIDHKLVRFSADDDTFY